MVAEAVDIRSAVFPGQIYGGYECGDTSLTLFHACEGFRHSVSVACSTCGIGKVSIWTLACELIHMDFGLLAYAFGFSLVCLLAYVSIWSLVCSCGVLC